MRNIIFLLLVSCSNVYARSFTCEIQENTVTVFKTEIESRAGQKVNVGEASGVRTFLTEKSNHYFEIEAFIPDVPARSYAESQLSLPGDALTLTFWGREQLMALKCYILQ